jgi:hypothetical protein
MPGRGGRRSSARASVRAARLANSISHGGYLYEGIETARLPFPGARIMRTDGSRWEQVNVDGFGDRFNHNIIAMEFFNGDLYAGTWNAAEGTQVWRATPGGRSRSRIGNG